MRESSALKEFVSGKMKASTVSSTRIVPSEMSSGNYSASSMLLWGCTRRFAILHATGMFVADVARPDLTETVLLPSPTEFPARNVVAVSRFIFLALAHKFPGLLQKFPVLLPREFRRRPLDLLVSRPLNSCGNAEFCKIPC